MSDGVSRQIRQLVGKRAEFCCEYCLSPVDYSPDPFCIEHIWPRALQGSDDQANLAYSCLGCNSRKFVATEAVDPMTGEMATLYHPRHDRWADHFSWESDRTLVVGISATGRASVQRLELNRDGIVNLRRVLRACGVDPMIPNRQLHLPI
ncbi:MAG: HNH endonuclease [Pirellulaceae bacterium]